MAEAGTNAFGPVSPTAGVPSGSAHQGHAIGAPGRARPRPDRMREDAEVTEGIRELEEGTTAESRAAAARKLACAGAATCRALRAGAHRARRCRRSAPPLPQAGGSRSNASIVTAPAQRAGPSSTRQALFRLSGGRTFLASATLKCKR